MKHSTSRISPLIVALSAALALPAGALAGGPFYTPWSEAEPAPDTGGSVAGGCPHESRDGLTIYMASGQPGGQGDLDIWVAHRESLDEAFGEAENLPHPVNSAAPDFCPTPVGGKYLFFVSARPAADACGSGDIYLTRYNPAHGWQEPVHLDCAPDGPNTAGGEFSPSLVETDDGVYLFYSSNGTGNMDIYRSELQPDGTFGPGQPVAELNTAFDDRMPNISKDGREIVFSSSRLTWGESDEFDSHGGQDVYASWRDSTDDPWSAPVNLGGGINTGADETRASLSWDRERLYFGRSGEIYVSERSKINGPK
jgi:Tol biopolymer transport system component